MKSSAIIAFFLRHRRGRQTFLLTSFSICLTVYIFGCLLVMRKINAQDGALSVILGINSNRAARKIFQATKTVHGMEGRLPNPPLGKANGLLNTSLDFKIEEKRKIKPWKQFLDEISVDEMYSSSSGYMPDLLNYLSTAKIVNVTIFKGGTQIKFLLVFEDGNTAIAKPMRNPREMYWANDKSQPFWYDPERHTAEIASFHLDRILNYRRVPPCAGRRVSFSKEIINKTNDEGILHTLKKRDGNDCFIGICPFCDEDHMICSKDDVMELSVCQQIPGKIYDQAHPWSQGIKESKVWKSKNVCPTVLSNRRMNTTRFFLDTMELALFDYLIVNYDRHHIAYLDHIDIKRSFAAIIDNGKGFANPFTDDVTFLAPIYQCCRFRNSTYQHILGLTKNNNTLGELMKRSLSQDPLAPILTEPFYATLDRRLSQFYYVLSKCLESHVPDTVLAEK